MGGLEGFGRKKRTFGERAKNFAQGIVIGGGVLAGAHIVEGAKSVDHAGPIAVHDVSSEIYSSPEGRRIALDTALLAHALDPNYREFEQDKDLQFADKIDPALVLPLVRHTHVGPEYWDGLYKEFVASDAQVSAMIHTETHHAQVRFDILKGVSNQYGGVDPIEHQESVAYVARNLSMKGQDPTPENVRAEVSHILERRAAIGDIDLLQQNILMVSNDETYTDAQRNVKLSFGTSYMREKIKERQRASTYHHTWTMVDPFVSPTQFTSTPASIAEAKKAALDAIAISTEPLTVYFDGHGSPQSFFISGQADNAGKFLPQDMISVDELAETLTLRYQAELKMHQQNLRISFIYEACDMQNFARNLAEKLTERGVPLPDVMISASEYGQYSFGELDPKKPAYKYGSYVNYLIAEKKTIGDIIEHKHEVPHSDPSIFVPRPENSKQLMQVSGIVLPSTSEIG